MNSAASTTSTSDRLTTVLSYGTLLLMGYLVYRIMEPFLEPLAWSAVLAIFFFPLHEMLKVRMRPNRAALVSTAGVTLLLIAPSLLVLVYTARQAIDAASEVQSAVLDTQRAVPAHAVQWLRDHLPAAWQSMDLWQPLRQGAERIAAFLAANFTRLVKNLFTFLVDLFIVIFALFFMFRDGDRIVRGVRHLLPFEQPIQEDVLRESRDLIFGSVAVGLVIAGIQGLLGGTAFAIGGISNPIFWGVVIAFFSLVPVVGSALIWIPGALYIGFTGHWGRAITVAVICGAVAGTADNIVRPLLLRNRTKLNDLLLFIAVLGGLEVFGLLGLVVGPAIFAAAMGVFRVYMHQRELAPPKLERQAVP